MHVRGHQRPGQKWPYGPAAVDRTGLGLRAVFGRLAAAVAKAEVYPEYVAAVPAAEFKNGAQHSVNSCRKSRFTLSKLCLLMNKHTNIEM